MSEAKPISNFTDEHLAIAKGSFAQQRICQNDRDETGRNASE